MTHGESYELFLRALRGEQTERVPIWMMRQAGRTDPEYNKLKEAAGLPLHELFRHPGHAATISLLPKRIGVDAIIFFQDILTPLTPMGAHFEFVPGPQLVGGPATEDTLKALSHFDMEEGVGFVGETFSLIQNELQGEMPVLGFAGAPFTLLVFMLQGKSFGDSIERSLTFIQQHPDLTHETLDKIADMTIAYLKYQAGCGAAAVQLFESAAHLVDAAMYKEFLLPYQQKIFKALEGVAPTINFAREMDDLALLGAAGADILSLPSSVTIAEARATLGAEQVVQGNVDNKLLVTGSKDEIEAAAKACLDSGCFRGHIFNLSHGLLRETPFENVVYLVEIVRSQRLPS